MQWNKMTKTQQNAARRISDKLNAGGVVDATRSQVARHFDDAAAWERGTITLAALCETAGWTAPASEETAERDELGRAIKAKVGADDALKAAIIAEHGRGTSANQIARRLDGVISRPVVLDMLGAASIRDRASRALRDAGFGLWPDGEDVDISDAPGRRVTLQLLTEGSTTERWNAAAGILDTMRTAGLVATRDGNSTLNMQEYIGEGGSAVICDA